MQGPRLLATASPQGPGASDHLVVGCRVPAHRLIVCGAVPGGYRVCTHWLQGPHPLATWLPATLSLRVTAWLRAAGSPPADHVVASYRVPTRRPHGPCPPAGQWQGSQWVTTWLLAAGSPPACWSVAGFPVDNDMVAGCRVPTCQPHGPCTATGQLQGSQWVTAWLPAAGSLAAAGSPPACWSAAGFPVGDGTVAGCRVPGGCRVCAQWLQGPHPPATWSLPTCWSAAGSPPA